MSQKRNERTANQYDLYSSEFYDFHAYRDDINFYLNYAKETTGKILDLGCGAGRDAIFMANDKSSVLGVDLSIELLKEANQALRNRDLSSLCDLIKAGAPVNKIKTANGESLLLYSVEYKDIELMEFVLEYGFNCWDDIDKVLREATWDIKKLRILRKQKLS